LALLLVVLTLLGVGCFAVLNDASQPKPGVTVENFGTLFLGMSKSRVHEILGPPLIVLYPRSNEGIETHLFASNLVEIAVDVGEDDLVVAGHVAVAGTLTYINLGPPTSVLDRIKALLHL
jgi:hypothetical protein